MTPRQQAKLYAAKAGKSVFAILMQLARLEKLDAESACRVLKEPGVMLELLETGPYKQLSKP